MIGPYRPHGPLRWLLDRLDGVSHWALVGALGAESRSATVPQELCFLGKLESCLLLRINDVASDFSREVKRLMLERERELRSTVGSLLEIQDESLMSELPELEPLGDRIEERVGESVVLDVSCLPKRFFFYITRRLLQSEKVKNVVAAVTIPEKYGSQLSKSGGSWAFLPSFGRERSDRAQPMLIIGVGYQHLNLLEVAESDPDPVRLLFPFPSKPPGAIKNWEFVRSIEKQKKFGLKPSDLIRVHPQATSLAFDILTGHCAGQSNEVWLAPFGPKSLSLAMLLFALAREAADLPVSIGYTQPPAYSATYSIGVERACNGVPVVHSYCLKLGGKNLYSHG